MARPPSKDPGKQRKARQRRPQRGDVIRGVFDGGAGGGEGPPPELPPDFPEPPIALDDEGRKCWKHHGAILATDGRFDHVRDVHTLAAFALAWARLVAAEKLITNEGLTVDTADGSTKKHPAVTIANEATTQIKQLAGELGLTPASRRRLPDQAEKEARDERKEAARRLLD